MSTIMSGCLMSKRREADITPEISLFTITSAGDRLFSGSVKDFNISTTLLKSFCIFSILLSVRKFLSGITNPDKEL